MNELDRLSCEIGKWHRATFGNHVSLRDLMERMRDSHHKLETAVDRVRRFHCETGFLGHEAPRERAQTEVGEEIAEALVSLLSLADRLGIVPSLAIGHKLRKDRKLHTEAENEN